MGINNKNNIAQDSGLPLVVRLFSVSLRQKLKLYRKKAEIIECALRKKPGDWGKYQCDYNAEIDDIFRWIMDFERQNLFNGRPDRVEKLRKIFIKHIHRLLLRGEYPTRSFKKPYGYSGDFKIIDDIYKDRATTTGYERLFDNYFLNLPISIAVRNRKEDFKNYLIEIVRNIKGGGPVRVMNLASGACREILELLTCNPSLIKRMHIDCYDNEPEALEYAGKLLKGFSNIKFYLQNALQISATSDIHNVIKKQYHCIYSTGLFDYLNHRISVRMVKNLRELLLPKGIIMIANVRDRYSNPSLHSMEWLENWPLVYRTDEEFERVFLEAGFTKEELRIEYEKQGLLQYILAQKLT